MTKRVDIRNKFNGRIVETIPLEDYNIDKKFIYSKDEFGQIVTWDRQAFIATMHSFAQEIFNQ